MSTQLFLRSIVTAIAGTLPAGSQSATTPTVTATGGTTNRSLSIGFGNAVQNLTVTTSATTSAQNALMGVFMSEPLFGSGTLGGGSASFDMAEQESNTSANFWINGMEVYIWRPGTGAKVGTVKAFGAASLGGTEPTAITQTQTTHITGIATSAVAYADGDIIVAEIWVNSTQAMATAYTGGLYYDDLTAITAENTVLATPASCITFAETVTFKGALAPTDKGPSLVLSNSNLTISGGAAGVYCVARSATSYATGKKYFQGKIDARATAADSVSPVGLCGVAYPVVVQTNTNWLGHSADSWALYDDGQVWNNNASSGVVAAIATGHWARMAVDFDAGKAWVGNESAWVGDPVAGTGNTITFTANTRLWIAINFQDNTGDQLTLNIGATAFNDAIPTGYASWDGSRVSGASGPLAATETGADTAALSGTVAVQGALGATEASDTAALSGTVPVQGSLAATEAGSDVAALAGTVAVQGSLAATETGADTCDASGTATHGGPLAAVETDVDTAALTGAVAVQGALDATEGADVAALAGTVAVQGSLAAAEAGSDTATLAGTVAVQGSLIATEAGSDAAALAGAVKVQGPLAATETGADVAALTGTVAIQGSMAVTESTGDSVSVLGTVLVQGTLTVTESASDTCVLTGAVKVQGSIAAIEAGSDVAALAGIVKVQGALTATESDVDTCAIFGATLAYRPSAMMMFFA